MTIDQIIKTTVSLSQADQIMYKDLLSSLKDCLTGVIASIGGLYYSSILFENPENMAGAIFMGLLSLLPLVITNQESNEIKVRIKEYKNDPKQYILKYHNMELK